MIRHQIYKSDNFNVGLQIHQNVLYFPYNRKYLFPIANSVPRSQSGVLSRNNTNSLKKRVDPQTVLQRNPHGSHITDSKAERDMQGAG